MPIDPMNPNPPYASEMEEQDPFALSPYLAARGQEGPSLTGAYAPPPEGGMVMGGGGVPQGDPDTMQADPLMDEVRRGSDPRMGLGQLAGAALAGLFGGGASEAAGHAAGASQDFLLQNLQKKQGLMAQDRERKFKMGEEAIQGAHEMMKQLHGKDMAGLPDHIKAEMTRLTELYNQKMLDGLTDKEAREILAVGARMQQLMQSAQADPTFGEGRAKARGTEAGIAAGAQDEAQWMQIGGKPPDVQPGENVKTYRARKNLEMKLKSAEDIARTRAEASGKQFSNRDWNAAVLAASRYLGINLQTVSDDPITHQSLIAEAEKIYEAGQQRSGNSPSKPGMIKGPDGVYRKVQ